MFLILFFVMYDFIKEKKEYIRVLEISLVGIAIFLLFWEARSRYIYFLIPIFCLLGACALTKICSIEYKIKLKENFKK